jgi:hypothetical protein
MRQALDTDAKIRYYTSRAIGKAKHHGQGIVAVLPSLAGYVRAYADEIEVLFCKGEMANFIWATFPGGRRIGFAFNHISRKIEAREHGIRGTVLRVFDNDTTQSELLAFFSGLMGS